MKPFRHIGVVGAGAWGTALAMVARRVGAQVTLWARETHVVETIDRKRENVAFLPGYRLDSGITATNDISEMGGVDAIFLVTPAQHTHQIAKDMAAHIGPDIPVLLCAKGIERASRRLMTAVVADVLPGRPLAVLSGPTFADEVAAQKPAATIVAGTNGGVVRRFVTSLADGRLRPYAGSDPCGAQIGGALKNVLAIGSGIVIGRALGENARAALITRGLAEMIRFGVAQGAQSRTLTGLAGFGDLCLTCVSEKSRNTALGIALGRGADSARFLADKVSVTEGVWTAAAIMDMAHEAGVSMPICQAIDAVLNHGMAIEQAIDVLLARPLTDE